MATREAASCLPGRALTALNHGTNAVTRSVVFEMAVAVRLI